MPLPSLPTGVELDLLELRARQRMRGLRRGLELVASAFCLLSAAGILLVVGLGMLVADGATTTALLVLGAAPLAGYGALRLARRALQHLRTAFGMRHTLERARLAYERVAVEVEARRARA